jgi:hypothetical protein
LLVFVLDFDAVSDELFTFLIEGNVLSEWNVFIKWQMIRKRHKAFVDWFSMYVRLIDPATG